MIVFRFRCAGIACLFLSRGSIPEIRQNCDHYYPFVGAFLRYCGKSVAGSHEGEKWRAEKNERRCCAKLYEKTDSLEALGSVASFLRNRKFYLINDNSLVSR